VSDEKRTEEDESTEAKDVPDQPAEKAEAKPAKAKADAEPDADEEADDVDSMDPAAIARRVAALGEEDETEKLAREEERKLAERRKAGKKGKKKRGGLEVAASKKLDKIGKRAEPKRNIAVAADADPLIEKTVKLSDWAKQNQKLVQRVGAIIAVALIGLAGWMYWDHKRETEASMALSKAVETQHAQIGEPPKDDDDNATDPSTTYYKTHEERREKALEKYREVEKKFAGTGAAILARLSEGSLLLDKHDADGAAAAYTEVKGSALGQADKEVRGRALEGLGFSYEIKADKAEGEAKKPFYDQALGAFKELENIDVKGFKELAMYHQARVHENKGEKDKAKELLVALKERLDKPDENTGVPGTPGGQSFPYLREVAMDRLRAIDPAAAPKMPAGMPGGGGQVLPPHIRKMLEDQQKKAAGGGGAPPGAPPGGGH